MSLTFVTALQTPYDFKKVTPIRNWWDKPAGGLWASPLAEDGNTFWEQWCSYEGYTARGQHRYKVTVNSEKVFTIDNLKDYKDLVTQYPTMRGGEVVLDYERMSRVPHKVGLVLTAQGLEECRWKRLYFGSQPICQLYTWDVPSLVAWKRVRVEVIYEKR